jgi:uncharacterized protein (DUF1778 family)
MSTPAKLKDERIDLRVSRSAKTLLQRAAAARQKSVTEFVLESGLAAAAEALADRRHFAVDSAQWNAFVAMLDGPRTSKPRLRKLLKSPSVLE